VALAVLNVGGLNDKSVLLKPTAPFLLSMSAENHIQTEQSRMTNGMKLSTVTMAFTLITIFCVAPAKADQYAYMAERGGDFGTIDLNSGAFSLLGNSGVTLTGMADHNGTLFGGSYLGGNLYTINPANGTVALVGSSAVSYELFGSTPSGLFALGSDDNLYSINGSTGAATLVGASGLSLSGSWFGFSTGSSSLYFSDGPNLYTLNTSTGAGTLVGNMGGPQLGAMLLEGGILYGGADSPVTEVDTINPGTGVATSGPNVTGTSGNFWALAPDPLTSTVPDESPTLCLLSLVALGSFLFRRRLPTLDVTI
jgi:hypothetical protein